MALAFSTMPRCWTPEKRKRRPLFAVLLPGWLLAPPWLGLSSLAGLSRGGREVREVGERPERFPVFVALRGRFLGLWVLVSCIIFCYFYSRKSCFVGFLKRLEEPGVVAIPVRQLAKPAYLVMLHYLLSLFEFYLRRIYLKTVCKCLKRCNIILFFEL